MTVGSAHRANKFNSNSSHATITAKFESRILGMQDQSFFQLTCDDKFEPFGLGPTTWSPNDLKVALDKAPELATDPAKGNKITDGGVEEAAVALTAEHLHVFESATRETTGGAEFIDNNGVAWDVKSPLSPPEGQNWQFSPSHQLEKIRHDLSQGDKVLFNLSRVNDKDRDDTLHLLTQELTCNERSQLLILTDQEVGSRAW